MKLKTTLINDIVLSIDEKENEIVAVVKFQGIIPLKDYKELLDLVDKQKDGSFDTEINAIKG